MRRLFGCPSNPVADFESRPMESILAACSSRCHSKTWGGSERSLPCCIKIGRSIYDEYDRKYYNFVKDRISSPSETLHVVIRGMVGCGLRKERNGARRVLFLRPWKAGCVLSNLLNCLHLELQDLD
jgi:hypothetical protein